MYKRTGPVNKETQTMLRAAGNPSCVRRHKIQTASAQAKFAEAEKPAAASAAAPPDVTMMLALEASTAQSRRDDRRCHQDDARPAARQFCLHPDWRACATRARCF
jgi:hypothetical protein